LGLRYCAVRWFRYRSPRKSSCRNTAAPCDRANPSSRLRAAGYRCAEWLGRQSRATCESSLAKSGNKRFPHAAFIGSILATAQFAGLMPGCFVASKHNQNVPSGPLNLQVLANLSKTPPSFPTALGVRITSSPKASFRPARRAKQKSRFSWRRTGFLWESFLANSICNYWVEVVEPSPLLGQPPQIPNLLPSAWMKPQNEVI